MSQITDEKERNAFVANARALTKALRTVLHPGDLPRLRRTLGHEDVLDAYQPDGFAMHPLAVAMNAALVLTQQVTADRTMALSVLLQTAVASKAVTIDQIRRQWDDDIADTVARLQRVATLYERHAAVESGGNFSRLVMALAEDIRVIIIMIVERLALMLLINHHPDEERVRSVSAEAAYLYAPLAHRLGLYKIKSQLEDLALKYTDRPTYTAIAHKLNQTKVSREAYIAAFIGPVKARLEAEGLNFDIKGRTKSIYSIYNKIIKQRTDVDHIYDLFAIRIIIDAPPVREKAECWLAYSVVTDMYTPNPARMKDWISIPKTNGYESLHITVRGPEERWVEVQIRTRRMDEVAEKGLAAHWRYKGVQAESDLDAWMRNVRDILDTGASGPGELMRNLRMDVYSHEVFVFTPKGDLYRLPMGASVLDFAFNIHTALGSRCTGARVNGRVVRINHKLQSGDTVEVLTSAQQQPKRDWLTAVVTGKARSRIRAALKEQEAHAAELGRELLQRRFKNRKIDLDEGIITRLVKKLGYKTATAFFSHLAEGQLEPGEVLDQYLALVQKTEAAESEKVSAGEFVMQNPAEAEAERTDDILEIGNAGDGVVKGLNYKLARCCNPIFGDKVFGFISSEGVVKIHRQDCPNAANIRARYPYRIIRTRWTGRIAGQMAATLRIIGRDDIGIVTDITSIINKEKTATLRNISIDSNDGLFQGYVIVGVDNTQALSNLIKKIKTVKGVKNVIKE